MSEPRSRPGRAFAAVAAVPTAVDVGLLVVLHQGLSVPLVAADVAAVAVASGVSHLAHTRISLRSDPYVRWVRMPAAFAAVAVAAGLVDVAVLAAVHAAAGGDGTTALLGAKAVALTAAALVRLGAYRAVLLTAVRTSLGRRHDRPPASGDRRATVVVPAYREAARIGDTVAALRAGLAGGADDDDRVEIVVVDDGSADGTASAALTAGADQVVVLPANRGKGAAVRAGMAVARGRTVVFTDADLAYGPAQVAGVITAVETGWDVVIGRRRVAGARTRGSALRAWGSRVVNLAAATVLLSRPRDTQCGLKGFRSDAAALVCSLARVDGFAFDVEVLHLAERHGLSVGEVPVEAVHDGRSTVRLGPDTVRLMADLVRIRRLGAAGAYELPGGPDDAH